MKPLENVGHFQSLKLGFKNFLYIFRSARKLLLDLQNNLIHTYLAGKRRNKQISRGENQDVDKTSSNRNVMRL